VRKFEKLYKYLNEEEVKVRATVDKKITFLTEVFGKDLVFVDILGLQGNEALENYRVMEEDLTIIHLTFGVAKNSSLLEPITIMTLRFMEV
jgi:hypothetical protein